MVLQHKDFVELLSGLIYGQRLNHGIEPEESDKLIELAVSVMQARDIPFDADKFRKEAKGII